MEINFSELRDGAAFEQLVRDVLIALNYTVRWSGLGPDDGKDLIVEEPGDPLFGAKVRRWLVSCKNFAGSRRSVNFQI